MNKLIGLWIDHKKAVFVSLIAGKETIQQIESGMEQHLHYRGATRPRAPYSAQYQQGDDQLDKQFEQHLNKFYAKVIGRLRDADVIFIFGPGEAKNELQKRLVHEKMGLKIAGVETSDKMTERQIATKVRKYFQEIEAAT
jgi:stalled ribosome rescue protein Dom34